MRRKATEFAKIALLAALASALRRCGSAQDYQNPRESRSGCRSGDGEGFEATNSSPASRKMISSFSKTAAANDHQLLQLIRCRSLQRSLSTPDSAQDLLRKFKRLFRLWQALSANSTKSPCTAMTSSSHKVLDFSQDTERVETAMNTIRDAKAGHAQSDATAAGGPFSVPGPVINGAPVVPPGQLGVIVTTAAQTVAKF